MKYLFFLVPMAALAYVMIRLWYILPFNNILKTISVCIAVLLFAVMIFSFAFGMEKLTVPVATVIYDVSTSWLFILLYLFMIFLCADILRAVHILPKTFLFNSMPGTLTVTAIVFAVFLYGNIHYYHKYRQQIDVTTQKKLDKDLKIVMISDLHLGYHNQRKTFASWVDMINKENPDLILIAGDVIDISPYPLEQQEVYKEFKRLNAPIYACLGNHEYISGIDRTKKFYSQSGIHLLIDGAENFENNLLIIGRNDRSQINRKQVSDLLQGQDTSKYMILLDHQPYNLEVAEKNNIDFQFSGHTHYGQVFPANLITDLIYEKAYGRHKRSNTEYYITSGLGIWGGKFRIGTRSEYVVLNVKTAD